MRWQPTDDPRDREDPEFGRIVPEDPHTPSDKHQVIGRVVDRDSFQALHADCAQSIPVDVARLGGRVVGVIAHRPAVLAGCREIAPSIMGWPDLRGVQAQ